MARERPWPWIVLALATGGLGWWLGRMSAPDAAPSDLGTLDRAPTGSGEGPILSGAPSRAGGRAPPPRPSDAPAPTEATPPPPPGTVPAPTLDSLPVPLSGYQGGSRRILPSDIELPPAAAEPTPEERAAQEAEATVVRLMQSDPEAATQRLTDLFRSGRPEDRRLAYRALAQARHPAHRTMAQRAVNTAREGDDIEALLRMLAKQKGRDWSPEQITGAPDTLRAGDLPTAWASKQPDMGEVWIEVDFPEAVAPESLRIHETLGPGCLARVFAQEEGGAWTQVWAGTPLAGEAPTWCEVPLDFRGRTRSLRLIVDTSRSPGWNEIDAVELVGDGRRQWAHAARAGSSYSD